MIFSLEKTSAFVVDPNCKPSGKHQCHLLCVDDEKVLVLLTARVLETNGYQVTALSNPLEAVDLFNRENIELAILDYEMPEMSGARLAAQLKSARSKLKVILFTGVLQVPEADLSPVDAVVHKSEGVEKLLATVDGLLATP
jgi:CheY-like chemotaxis protein